MLCHPSGESLGAALAAAVAGAARDAGAEVTVHDLYRDGFDPRLAASEVASPAFADPLAERYARDLLGADAVAVVHPVWFFGPPAVLKGWVERVVREGVAFEVGPDGRVAGRLRARAALVVTTGNAGVRTEEALGDPVTRFWRDVAFGPAGVTDVRRLAFAPVRGSSAEERASWLAAAERETATLVEAARAYLGSRRAER